MQIKMNIEARKLEFIQEFLKLQSLATQKG